MISKTFLLALLLLPLAGCTLTAPQLTETKQLNDLTDPDSDGVINAREQCADTKLGSLVNNYGCPNTVPGGQYDQLHVLFEHDKSVIRPEYMANIKDTADFMLTHPDLKLVVEGHASSPGTDQYNLALAQRRANVVKKVMVEKYGVPADRIEAKTYGERSPAVGKEDSQAYTVNRRAVGTLMSSQMDTEMKWNVYSVEK